MCPYPDATLNVLKVLKFKKGKIITIIGLWGDRDTTKLTNHGEIAHANIAIMSLLRMIITNQKDPQKIGVIF